MSRKQASSDVKRKLVAGPLSLADRFFFGTTTAAAYFAFVLVILVLAFLLVQSFPILQKEGFDFVLGNIWNADDGIYQLGPMLWGSLFIALFGIVIATPMAVALAYLIVFLLPKRLATIATNLVDLLAALPSVIIGLWGLMVFGPTAAGWAEILNKYLGFIPLFSVQSSENGFFRSPFIASWIVAVMIIPIITSVTREIFSQLDRDLVNGALALGGSRLSVFRRVIFPTSAGGVVGGVLLGLGRAIGETVAIFYVLNLSLDINWSNLLEPRGGAIASWILAKFGESSPEEKQALMAAGLVLFVVTLVINFLASVVVNRSQSWRKN
jgi:phosphate transport system permease protein